MSSDGPPRPEARAWVARAFTAVEDVVYVGLGVLLTGIVLTLLVNGFIGLAQNLMPGSKSDGMIHLLDRSLLILLIVELLYTVQVSFRAHALVPEPFLLVGLISVIRRVLILTAEFGEWREKSASEMQHFALELAVLTALILALAISLVLLRRSGSVAAERG